MGEIFLVDLTLIYTTYSALTPYKISKGSFPCSFHTKSKFNPWESYSLLSEGIRTVHSKIHSPSGHDTC